MKVVMLSPLPPEQIKAFCADCREVVVCELNYQGQFANLLTAAMARAAGAAPSSRQAPAAD